MLEFGVETTRVANPVRSPRCDYAIGTFLGERVEASLEDLAPVKNHLPPKFGVRLMRNQGRVSLLACRGTQGLDVQLQLQ